MTKALSLAGIGSRRTPEEICVHMRTIGRACRQAGLVVHSGHAEGADWAFEEGAQESCMVHLPWPSYNQHLTSRAIRAPLPTWELEQKARHLVRMHHPAPGKLRSSTMRLHSRNAFIIYGTDLESPVSAAVCWTPEGRLVGGTAMGIRLARAAGIPVFNFGSMTPRGVSEGLRRIYGRRG